MQTSGASRRGIADAYLQLFWLFENRIESFGDGYPTYQPLPRRVGQRRKYPRPRTNALVKTLQVIFFVRRMDVVVVEPKTHQHRIETERALEIRDDRDRGAR